MARILLVDDEPYIRLFYSDLLAAEGHQVIEASSSQETLDQLRRKLPKLVVLDLKLGADNGLDLLQRIVHDYDNVPVMVLSAYASFQDDFTCWLADSYVMKSSSPKKFLREVNKILGSQDQEIQRGQTRRAHSAT